jgi:hypothetical protein
MKVQTIPTPPPVQIDSGKEIIVATKPETGPDEEDRKNPGSEQINPTGRSSDAPAEGADDAPSKQPGSPEG